MFNPILNADSYKYSMFLQYPPKTEFVCSYIESRGGIHPQTLFFGLQYFIKSVLMAQITLEMVNQAEKVLTAHGEPFDREMWLYIVEKHNGFLPLHIRAVDEGSVVDVKNVLVTVVNTDPRCFSLTTFIETALLRAVWYPTTVATNSYFMKKLILSFLEKTGTPEAAEFKLHDFGSRGVSSYESASIGSLAHLLSFRGTDSISALTLAMDYYNAKDPVGFSIPASEHSTITSWGRDNEAKAYQNMIKQFGKKDAIFAVVSDSYDIFNAVENIWGNELKQEVIDSGATLVIRPDSGDPATIIECLLELIAKQFGYTVNDKGYRVFNNVRLIQGDGVNHDTIQAILTMMTEKGYSADNIAFGQGGALLQIVNRDDPKFEMKCSAVSINGQWTPVQKDPFTDPGKKSKTGLLDLVATPDGTKTIDMLTFKDYVPGMETLMKTVYFWNGLERLRSERPMIVNKSFEDIRSSIV